MAGIDTGWGFPPQFYNHGKDVGLVSGTEDIREALEILFGTAIQERYQYSDYGCDLRKYMFEAVNFNLVVDLQQMMLDAIYKYEPRITVLKFEITEAETNARILYIHLDYSIKATGQTQSLVYPVSVT